LAGKEVSRSLALDHRSARKATPPPVIPSERGESRDLPLASRDLYLLSVEH